MFRKYEKTKRIKVPQVDLPKGKRCLNEEEVKQLLSGKVVITEKLDGANGGIVATGEGILLQKRGGLIGEGEHAQYSRFKAWMYEHLSPDLYKLKKGTVIYGEIMFITHTVYYDNLPDWFLVYDIWTGDRYADWPEVEDICAELGLTTVPFITHGEFYLDNLYGKIPYRSNYGSEKSEGIVVKNYTNGLRGKLVRPQFIKSMDSDCHWTKHPTQFNKIRD